MFRVIVNQIQNAKTFVLIGPMNQHLPFRACSLFDHRQNLAKVLIANYSVSS